MNTDLMPVRVAVLDLYEGFANQGMRCIRELVDCFGKANNLNVTYDVFDVRLQNDTPDLSYDIYISSGGPGSPLESEGSEWEKHYFNWLSDVEDFNADDSNPVKKQVFFICHSFQLVCRHYQVGHVSKRGSTSFGVFPMHPNEEGNEEPIFAGLKDPFYAVDSRDYQVTTPNEEAIERMGAKVLAIEKERPHKPEYERAVMAIRFNENFIGTQFHPEADAIGMRMYLQTEERKKTVVENHGEEKWASMVEQLADPDKILFTQHHILPNFLRLAVQKMQEMELTTVSEEMYAEGNITQNGGFAPMRTSKEKQLDTMYSLEIPTSVSDLHKVDSEQKLQILLMWGKDIFGSREQFDKWLYKRSSVLGDRLPADLIQTAGGVDLVINELKNIAYGNLA